METKSKKNKPIPKFKAVETCRAIKEKISSEIADMDFAEIKAYLQQGSEKLYTELGKSVPQIAAIRTTP
jgi:hypothetical protein